MLKKDERNEKLSSAISILSSSFGGSSVWSLLFFMGTPPYRFVACIHILCKIKLAIFDVTYIFDHLRAILDISLI